MTLPLNEKIIYSATALHDFKQCPRRYELKYLQRQPWPAPHAEPLSVYDLQQQRGQLFHQLAERYYLGIHPDLLTQSIKDETVQRWWLTFLDKTPAPKESTIQLSAETRLSAEIQGHRFDVLYDLLRVDPQSQKLTIFDWKTTPKPPQNQERQRAVQTQLYMAVAGQLRQQFLGQTAVFEDISMVYWFPEHPDESITIHYDAQLHEQYLAAILEIIAAIEQRSSGPSPWPLTENQRTCNYCVYRSLCGRGVLGGALDLSTDLTEERDEWAALFEDLLF